MSTSEAPTIAERYGRAVRSSRLVVEERTRGDADLLIAAGWTAAQPLGEDGQPLPLTDAKRRDRLAVALYRLASEFDAVRADTRGKGPLNRTEALLILSRLKSLPDTKAQLGAFATVKATKWAFMRPDSAVAIIAGQVLDVWLDPTCHHCDGRGFNGGFGEPQVFCRPCRGSGKRRDKTGRDAEEREFAHRLLADMDGMLAAVDGAMRRFMRQR